MDASKKKKIRAQAVFKKHNHTLHNNKSIRLLFSSRKSKEASTIKWALFNWVLNMASDKMYLQKVITKNQTPKCVSIFPQSN